MAEAGGGLTYAAAGVDTSKQKAAIKALASAVTFSRKGRGAPVTGLAHFAGVVAFGDQHLAICTDGVGTKLKVAAQMKKWDTVGIDCIAMNVNDCICVGAEPLAFVDYIATAQPDPEITAQIGIGLNEGARQANVTLAGGETAIVPELVNGLDLAGTCVGAVDAKRVVDGSKVKKGDLIIGLQSSGLHSNGYTLARKIVGMEGVSYSDRIEGLEPRTRTLGEAFLEPTRIYVKSILHLLRAVDVHGLANITGGGLKNVPRVNPRFRYVLTEPLAVPGIFRQLQAWGRVENQEMYQTFNMGMGFAAIVPPRAEKEALRVLKSHKAKVVGEVRTGRHAFHEPLGLEYASKT